VPWAPLQADTVPVTGMQMHALRGRVVRRLRGTLVPRLTRGRPWALEGNVGIAAVGHRGYVGGRWDELGQVQLDWMVSQGLRPHHVFLDIACGALRGGIHFTRYLDAGNYLGLEKEKTLVRRGLYKELPRELRKQKRPEFVVSDAFEFDRFSKSADFSLAQSLFTHLVIPDIELCLGNLRAWVPSHHQFYATFALGESSQNAAQSHTHKCFYYSPEELTAVGRRHGWLCNYLGDWGQALKDEERTDVEVHTVMMQFLAD
jgi:hypothetical protein